MIVVLTCRRSNTSYVEQTVRQIDKSAKGTRVLLVDGDSGFTPAGWRVEHRTRPVAPRQNKWVAWEAFKLAEAEDEDLCFFEDDLEFATNAPGYIEDFRVPDDLAFVTFFSTWLEHKQPMGLWRIHPHSYVMAQALKFPLRTVRELVDVRDGPLWHEGRLLGGFDEILRHISICRGWRYGIINPGIVQHVGTDSAVGNGGLSDNRVAHNYTGPEFDAATMKLFPPEFFS